MKIYYPTVFYRGEEKFIAEVPDLQGCLTQGDDLQDAMNWIVDAIGTWLDGLNEKDYPPPSKAAEIDLSVYPEGAFVNIIEFDTEKYFRTIKSVAQKKGLNLKKTAELIGCPYRTMQNYWSGERRPPAWIERLIIRELES